MDTDSFIFHIKTEDIYKNIADDVKHLSHQAIKIMTDYWPQK